MATVLWLDDEPRGRLRAAIAALEQDGHDVVQVISDGDAVSLLDAGEIPDVIIQDLLRPPSNAQTKGLPPRTASLADSSGWAFYLDVLRPGFPQIPVLICTYDAHIGRNISQADDFNLTILPKGPDAPAAIVKAVRSILNSQRRIVEAVDQAPAVLVASFDKVNAALIAHLSKAPADMHKISWANFESLVARLLKEMGYEVLHTPLTRDGGVDLWAVQRSDLGEVVYAIDAKKYAPSRIVGPEPVRAIHGVADMAGASVGMIVTTSTFGPAARVIANQFRYRVSLKEFDDVCAWIRLVAGRSAI